MKSSVKLALVLLFVWAGASAAQNISSSVKGVVVDPAGAAVPGAKCALSNQATGATLNVVSDSDGSFVFPNVLAGTYSLTVEAAGFNSLVTRDINVSASETRALGRLGLQLGEVRQTVSVVAEGSAVQLVSSEKSGVITGMQLQDIAVKGRDFFALLNTVPGVVDNFSQRREASSPDSIRGTFINGQRENQKNLAIDGITDLDTGSNSTVHFQPNMDAIAEIKILTSNYQAEFGRNGGGVITVITKGGGRDFHGSAYNFYRHESLNANNFVNNRSGRKADGTLVAPKNPYRYRITGYSIGGPVYIPKKFNADKSKYFFFWSQEYVGTRKDYGDRKQTTPTEMERRGDFSQSFDTSGNLILIRDPALNGTCSTSNRTGCFPNNIIPTSRINRLGQAMLNFFPTPNYVDPDPANRYRYNYRSAYSGAYPKRQDMLRIDANVTPNFRVFWRYIKDKDEQDTPFGLWVNGDINYHLTPIRFGQPGKGNVVHVSNVISPTLVNEFIFGKSRNNLYFDPVDPSAIDRSKVGNPPEWFRDTEPGVSYMPNIRLGGQHANPIVAAYGNIPYQNWNDIYSFVDNIGKVWGKHSIKAGVYIERTGKFQVGGGNYRGNFDFARNTNNPFDANDGFANALLGNFNTYSEATARVDGDWWFWNVEWYLQDNWRVNNRLTLDFGMRFYHLPPMEDLNRTLSTFVPGLYDRSKAAVLYQPGTNPQGQRVARDPRNGALAPVHLIGQFVPGSGDYAPGMAIGGVNGFPAGLMEYPWLAYGPRFGFALDVFGNGRTALRGGFGMFKDRLQGNPTFNTNGNPPVAYSPTLSFGNLDTYAGSGGAIGPTNMNTLLGEQKQSTTMNFSFGIQHQMWKTTIDASYVGGLSRHLMGSRNINPIPMYARFDLPRNADPTRPTSPLPDNFLRPYVGLGDINLRTNDYTSNYNAFQLSVNRRFTRGLQFGVAYTYSKTLGVADGDTSGVSPYFSPRTRNYGPLGFDRRNVFVANYIYELPKLGTRTGFAPLRWILDNWEVSGMTTFQTGAPMSIGLGTRDGEDISGSAEGARVTIIGNPHLPKSERSMDRWFNTAAFARTPRGSFGNAGINYLTGPGINNWDIAISKRVPITEGRFVQFRTEMFNAWNHTQFNAVYTGTNFDGQRQSEPNFGKINVSSAGNVRDPRLIQLSLRVVF